MEGVPGSERNFMKNPSDLAALSARLEALQHEQAELARFALIGQAFIGLAHELNNALNSMMLQTSVVQMRVDEQGRQELAAIRQHGAQAAGLVRTLQHVVQERREKSYPVDLNSVLTEIVEEEPELRRRISLCLSPKAPLIHSTRSAVKQMIRLLLEGVCTGTRATVKAATAEHEDGAVLRLTLAGAASEDSTAEALLWQNLDEVGRLAGQSLLRQLGGALTAERSGDARILHVIWRQTM
jgi:phosphoglycerate-specific signal transduction histidine kinase